MDAATLPRSHRLLKVALAVSLGLLFSPPAFGLSGPRFVFEQPERGDFVLASGGQTAAVLVDVADYAGVVRAANDFCADLERVTGARPARSSLLEGMQGSIVIIGTVGKGGLVDRLISEKKLDPGDLRGQWESFLIATIDRPQPGVESALVIAGSDQRGTIFGIYELCEQLGVSPWYWWADVPVPRKASLFVRHGAHREGPPGVKYRGIFLNDEAPALTGWVKEKFGDYNHKFYTNVFQLLLRLKANCLWPAMWNNCFALDDPLNAKLANEYGVVIGTSHVEPMMRADKEWNRKGYRPSDWDYEKNSRELEAFWTEGIERTKRYESIVTLGMRGKIDTPMSERANVALLERIVAAQRQIIGEHLGREVTAVPQVWALYKEVQEYYEKGMRVPDDVTLLWCDDNWGNLRRLPTPDERRRAGGAGIYYHLDYVGEPRNYKWLNTVALPKIWQQMNLAYHAGADRIWIVNVGDLKPLEVPMEFFLTLAWRPERWPREVLPDYTRRWAEREFGARFAAEIGGIVDRYSKFNGRRKPELLEPGTFSLVNYREAERVLADWQVIAARAEEIQRTLPDNARPAFYELVLHPAKACANLNELYITVERNRMYARQGRASANEQATHARRLFAADQAMSDYFNHALLRGKWNHLMDQTHIGYTGWQEPPSNSMPALTELVLPEGPHLGVAIEGCAAAWPGATNPAVLPVIDSFNRQERFIEVFNRGTSNCQFSARASDAWIRLSSGGGSLQTEAGLSVGIDWALAPAGSATGTVTVASPDGDTASVQVPVFNPLTPARRSLKGFVESEGCVSIEAEHYHRSVGTHAARWEKLDGYGNHLGGMTILPPLAPSVVPPTESPRLEYRVYLFSTGAVSVVTCLAPTLNISPARGVALAVSFDDEPPQTVTAVPRGYLVENGNQDWAEAMRRNGREVKSRHFIGKPGYHTLKVWMVDAGLVLEKLVIDTGGLKPSYLGPPESFRGN